MRKATIRTEGMGPGVQTPFHLCLHTVCGRIRTVKTCIHDYQCWHCAFDQWLDEMEVGAESQGDLDISKNLPAIAA
jgi:hypothetical protein